MRFDHFSVVGIMLAKCKIQHFTNHWPSVNQRDAANIHKPNLRPNFCATRDRIR